MAQNHVSPVLSDMSFRERLHFLRYLVPNRIMASTASYYMSSRSKAPSIYQVLVDCGKLHDSPKAMTSIEYKSSVGLVTAANHDN